MALASDDPVLELTDVSVRTPDGVTLLGPIDWQVGRHDRWVVLGPNGGGKTTLVQVASMHQHPSTGRVRLLGHELGRCDVRDLRRRLGVVSARVADALRPSLIAVDVVVTARHGALEPWWHAYDDADRQRARDLLEQVGCGGLAGRTFGTLSSGERQRVLLARALMTDPAVLFLDEPNAGLDFAGREQLVSTLAALAEADDTPPLVLVTHHVEEIPPGTTHALLLAAGSIVAAGPIESTLMSHALSTTFGLDVVLERRGRRYTAWTGG